jgi:hypothetical protein
MLIGIDVRGLRLNPPVCQRDSEIAEALKVLSGRITVSKTI